MEESVLIQIKENLVALIARQPKHAMLKGFAGGACGGDILFHEACLSLNIPSEVLLPMPADAFKKESVDFAGAIWSKRFDDLYRIIPHLTLPPDAYPPQSSPDQPYDIWTRANLWMLDKALAHGGKNMTLMAVWDGKGGDGPGGTEHMITIAREAGAESIIIGI